MKALLALALIAALWAEWPRGNPAPAQEPAPVAAPAALMSSEAPGVAAPATVVPRKRVAAPVRAPSPSPSPSPSPLATEISEADAAYTRKVQAIMHRQRVELNDFLLQELKLDLHAVFEFHEALTEFDSRVNRESLVMHASDDWRQWQQVCERLTRERDQKIENLMSKAGYEDYLAFVEKQRVQMYRELGWD